jgi:trehalose 6-phosphate synthase
MMMSGPLPGMRRNGGRSLGRLVVVSNRVAPTSDSKPNAGGLAVGVIDALRASGGLWFGWSGEIGIPAAPVSVQAEGIEFVTVDLARRDYEQYYRGFSNATLWPNFHYRVGLTRYSRTDYAGYLRVNEWLAAQLRPLLRPDDVIWVHDYHLIPFGDALRRAGVNNRIGFFLHIPFPTPQVLTTIPPHAELVRALCAYDLVGFQTESDQVAFTDYVVREAGGTVGSEGRLRAFNRETRAGVYPIGIDVDGARQSAQLASSKRQAKRLAESLQHRRLILSVDRLDYSKGLLERFRAFEYLLETWPSHQNKVSFMQIAPPSRSDVPAYGEIRRDLEREGGRINGRFADLDWTPVRYLNRGFGRPVLMALFSLARVGFVTPLRDGMNLVAKEYVAAQDPEDPGVLVLSRFAGASEELRDAIVVNPYDTAGVGEALDYALSLPLEERRRRHGAMMARLRRGDIGHWRDRFLSDLAEAPRAAAEERAAAR